MKKIFLSFMICVLAISCFAADKPDVVVSEMTIKGRIEGENITFDISFQAEVNKRNAVIPILKGDAAHLDSSLPRKSRLERKEGAFLLTVPSKGKHHISLSVASRAEKDGLWRQTSFAVPAASVRKLSVICDRDDLEIVFPGALSVEKGKVQDRVKEGSREMVEKTEVTAYLGLTKDFIVRWKPSIKRLTGELVVASDVNTIVSASVGAMKVDNLFMFRVVQGTLKKLSLTFPKELSITQVMGEDIQEWTIDDANDDVKVLDVTLGRGKEDLYKLQVVGEMVLSEFPCKLNVPVVTPKDVIRSSGFLMLGTDSAIKLLVSKTTGLTQVDQTAFPSMMINSKPESLRAQPERSRFAYQYANMPYTLSLSCDDIVPEFSADDVLTLFVEDNDYVFNGSVQLDVRDAGAREIVLETDPDWIVANVSGGDISDYDVRDVDGRRLVRVFFSQAVMGRVLIGVRLEKSTKEEEESFDVPIFKVREAKSERGCLILAAEKGSRLKAKDVEGLREVHTGSVGVQVDGAQLAYRFKDDAWSLSVQVERTKPTVHTELLNVVSIGEGILYCSCSIMYRIDGAPVRSFKVNIPEEYQNIEFIGPEIRGWQKEDDVWEVTLQEKVMGDYLLGFTYDMKFGGQNSRISAGGIQTVGSASESGYIVLASLGSLDLDLVQGDSVIEVNSSEIPKDYMSSVTLPVIKAYKYVKPGPPALLDVKWYDAEKLVDQIADFTSLSTQVSRDGEAVTTVNYFIKNLSRQYMELSLPEDANLWWVKMTDQRGRKMDVTPVKIENEKEKKLLIPVTRLQNPDDTIRIELQYAESLRKIGPFGRKLKFNAPAVIDSCGTYVEWNFNPPDGYRLTGSGGNMEVRSKKYASCIPAVFASSFGILRSASGRGWSLLIFALLALWAVCFVVKGIGMRKRVILRIIVAVVVLVGVGVVLAGYSSFCRPAPKMAKDVPTVLFSRTLNLSGVKEPTASLKVVPDWIAPRCSLAMAIIAGAAGLWLAVRSLGQRKKSLFAFAVGMSVLTYGAAQFVAGQIILSVVLVAGTALWIAWTSVRRSYRKGLAMREDESLDDTLDAGPLPFEPEGSGGSEGYITAGLLSLLACAALMISSFAVLADDIVQVVDEPTVKHIEMTVQAPDINTEGAKSAYVSAVYEFTLEEPGKFAILRPPAVLREFDLGSRDLEIRASENGYILVSDDDGKYKVELEFSVPVVEQNGEMSMCFPLPANLGNRVTVNIPELGLDVQSDEAVLFRTEESEAETNTTVTAVFGSSLDARISWRARARKTKLEKELFFCEANTLALLEPGAVDLTSVIKYMVAQGEITSMSMTVPEGMSVTAVTAPFLSTWRFDSETRMLEALLEKPLSGEIDLLVRSQIASGSLPYDVSMGAFSIKDAAIQRGSLALAVPDNVQIQVGDTEGLNPMNIEDVPGQVLSQSRRGAKVKKNITVKRAFRYQDFPVSVKVRADQVMPEVRVVEGGELRVSDEKLRLSTTLKTTISKAGVFSLGILIPKGYDVDYLSGSDISHWDEVEPEKGEGSESHPKKVQVHFKQQVLGDKMIKLDISRSEKGLNQVIEVPRVVVENAMKHEGTVRVSGDHGVRMTTVEKEGVSEINPRDLGIREVGVLAFKILRPEWLVKLRAEVVEPMIRTDVLQKVVVSEGRLKGSVFINYDIAHAGCKTFRIKAPAPGIPLAINGLNIAQAHEVDKEQGIWEVQLHEKQANEYSMRVDYQVDFRGDTVPIKSLITLGTESQKGYLVVMSEGRAGVAPLAVPAGLQWQDARAIQGSFNAGDLSDAIYCYRTISGEYSLNLSVVRHKSENVLAADINSVKIATTVTDELETMSKVNLRMVVGDLSGLEVWLPGKNAELLSALVAGAPATVSKKDDHYVVALGDPPSGRALEVELTYSDSAKSPWYSRSVKFEGPRFDLPLKNIEWTFFVPEGRFYYGFDGTLEYKREEKEPYRFTMAQYGRYNDYQRSTREKARASLLEEGRKLAQQGDTKAALKVYRSAWKNASDDLALNEDAKTQYKNLVNQQAAEGFLNRQEQIRIGRNIHEENQAPDQLDKNMEILQKFAEKSTEQQVAAEHEAQAIQITFPEDGKSLHFGRKLQINTQADMEVSFKASNLGLLKWVGGVAGLLVLALGYMGLFRGVFRRRSMV